MISVDRKKQIGYLISDISGVEFSWAYQGYPEEGETYISGRLVKVSGQSQGDRTFREEVPGEPKEVIRNVKEYMFYLTSVGVDSEAVLEKVVDEMMLRMHRDRLKEMAGFAYISASPVRQIPDTRGTQKYTLRYSADLLLRTSSEVSGDIYVMESSQIKEGL